MEQWEQEHFTQLAQEHAAQWRPDGGVGTLGEKLLHRTVKEWLQPSGSLREVSVGRAVVDALTVDGLQEVQTRNFFSLKKKLPPLLNDHRVTVVYPLPDRKWIVWIDPETGEATPPRRSPKRGMPWDAARELVHLLPLLTHPNLQFRLLFLDVEEYRLQNGWDQQKKRGSTRQDRLPLALTGEVWLREPADYLQLLPSDLSVPFTRRELEQKTHLTGKGSSCLLAVLRTVGMVEPVGKQGRAVLYQTGRGEGCSCTRPNGTRL